MIMLQRERVRTKRDEEGKELEGRLREGRAAAAIVVAGVVLSCRVGGWRKRVSRWVKLKGMDHYRH